MLWLCRIVGPLGLESLNYLNLLNHGGAASGRAADYR